MLNSTPHNDGGVKSAEYREGREFNRGYFKLIERASAFFWCVWGQSSTMTLAISSTPFPPSSITSSVISWIFVAVHIQGKKDCQIHSKAYLTWLQAGVFIYAVKSASYSIFTSSLRNHTPSSTYNLNNDETGIFFLAFTHRLVYFFFFSILIPRRLFDCSDSESYFSRKFDYGIPLISLVLPDEPMKEIGILFDGATCSLFLSLSLPLSSSLSIYALGGSSLSALFF